ncbi:hypothetical protein BKH46_05075 [Helicobacter sp. 12S02634-8]|uniref:hypothetical protein n=1 Tax=Helicobacter sp. 12S02634-8 TaxID=1476199 RepID=UPI000BA6F3E9|nr:hypothetical protein [Helicobacter sp. 12S02634-8]PAF47092.1 hypothetical protein BKH46_05075 [Helicobacter sp. 12S02634-8]
MFYNGILRLENYIQSKSKQEYWTLIALLIALIFSVIYFWLFPLTSQSLALQQQAHDKQQSNYHNNTLLKDKLSAHLQDTKPPHTPPLLESFKKVSKDNEALLVWLQTHTKHHHLEPIADIALQKDGLTLLLQGDFQDFMEWMRVLEEQYFVFVEDLRISPQDSILTYEIQIKNLGNML